MQNKAKVMSTERTTRKAFILKELIVDKLKEFDNENVTKLAIDLYEYLSKDKLYESEELINQFFHEHYRSSENVVEDENTPKEDVQVTFKEVLE